MKVTRARVVTFIGIMMSSLLLFFAANCSFEKPPKEKTVCRQLEGKTADKQKEDETFVANPFCIACHYNFDEEELAFKHEIVGIGCERCHGESQRHRSDENNITPPEIMYPRQKINPTCMMCHPRNELKKNLDHNPVLAGSEIIFDEDAGQSVSGGSGQNKYCTDCHGKQHRINVRSVRWDKATGKLLRAEQ